MDKKIMVTRSSMPSYEEYIEAIKPLWDSHWLTNMGKYHQMLEEKLKEYLGVPELSLFVNGHMALEMAIQSFEFAEDSEIITTPFTFISTTHAIIRNHLKPVFCDVKLTDGTIDETKIEKLITKNTVAIVPVHVYGHVCNIDAIQQLAEKYKLRVIYDACHAFGETYKKRGIGNYGDASVFSFHASKVYNTIEGGAIAFSDHRMYNKLYNLKNFGIRDEELIVEVGANAKMNEFCAVMGLCNLRHIKNTVRERKVRYEKYIECIKDIEGIRLLDNVVGDNSNYAYFPIVVEEDYPISRDALYDKLKEDDIYSRKYFYPLTSDAACFKGEYEGMAVEHARKLSQKVLTLPLYEDLELEEIEKIARKIASISNYHI